MRVSKGPASRRRKNALLKKAKGFSRGRNNRLRLANATVMRALRYAKRDRKVRKRLFRALWIGRLNAACREGGISYSRFIRGLQQAQVTLDRKILANLAVVDSDTFTVLVQLAKDNSATTNRAAA